MGLVKNILVAPDSFKGSMSSMVAAQCMCNGISKVFPDALLKAIPVADGGEGTIDAMIFAVQGEVKSFTVTGPLGEKVNARIGFLPDKTAVVEMAEASGLTLVNPYLKNPLKTTTYGVGELIKAAIDACATKIIIGKGCRSIYAWR